MKMEMEVVGVLIYCSCCAMWSQLQNANINNETNFHYLPDKMLRQRCVNKALTRCMLPWLVYLLLMQRIPLRNWLYDNRINE